MGPYAGGDSNDPIAGTWKAMSRPKVNDAISVGVNIHAIEEVVLGSVVRKDGRSLLRIAIGTDTAHIIGRLSLLVLRTVGVVILEYSTLYLIQLYKLNL